MQAADSQLPEPLPRSEWAGVSLPTEAMVWGLERREEAACGKLREWNTASTLDEMVAVDQGSPVPRQDVLGFLSAVRSSLT